MAKTQGGTRADYESTPISRGEYISALVHLYRGELYRANSWRIRLDNTTNWAVLATAGILTFSFRDGAHTHWTLLVGLALIAIFHGFEARRFRYADVWRGRVRMIEENFYGPILRRDPTSPDDRWGALVAEDLFRPTFKISRRAALRVRFVRNYWPIYGVVFASWCLKLLVHPQPAESWGDLQGRLSLGFLPWWLPLAYLGLFLGACLSLVLLVERVTGNDMDVWSERSAINGDL